MRPAADGPSAAGLTALARDVVARALAALPHAVPPGGPWSEGVSAVPVPAADAVLRECVAALCALARANQVDAPRVILLLKDAWRNAAPRRPTPPDGNTALARVVTLCIEAYYAPATVAHAEPHAETRSGTVDTPPAPSRRDGPRDA